MALPKSGGPFQKMKDLTIATGEVREGDLYFVSQSVTLAGLHDGDLIGFGGVAVISGEVTGDVILMGQTIDISGVIRDTVRVWGQSLTVAGEIEGDLLSFTATTIVHSSSHIRGNAWIFGGNAILDGIVEGNAVVTAGKATFNGTVKHDVRVEADAISIGPDAVIEGDLIYTSREELEIENASAVKGEIIFKEEAHAVEGEKERRISASDIFWWSWATIAAMIVGFVFLALFPRFAPSTVNAIDNEPVLGALVGFGTFLVVPAACLLAILLLISLPLGVITLVLFSVTLYLAKLPVALWIGTRILGRLGRPSASPFLGLVIGVVLLYLFFALPFPWVMFIAKLFITWLGLGAIILSVRERILQRQQQRPGHAPVLPSP